MKLVLFCDYGLDDAAATVDALFHAKEDGYDRVDLVAVAGNVPKEVSFYNAQKLVAHLDFPLPEVTIVDTRNAPQPEKFLKNIHGEDGMGSLFSDEPFFGKIIPFSAWLEEEESFDLLSLGPMTLVPQALKTGLVRRFVFMGGNVREKPNFGEYEFNHGMNLQAFGECVRHEHVAVTMDTCRHPLLDIQPNGVAEKGILGTIVNRIRQFSFLTGERGCCVWDDIAVKALRHPEWFALEEQTDSCGNRLFVAKYVLEKPYEEILPL